MTLCDEADLFAMELLLPKKPFMKWLLRTKELNLDYDSKLEMLGNIFGVEPERIQQRINMFSLN